MATVAMVVWLKHACSSHRRNLSVRERMLDKLLLAGIPAAALWFHLLNHLTLLNGTVSCAVLIVEEGLLALYLISLELMVAARVRMRSLHTLAVESARLRVRIILLLNLLRTNTMSVCLLRNSCHISRLCFLVANNAGLWHGVFYNFDPLVLLNGLNICRTITVFLL